LKSADVAVAETALERVQEAEDALLPASERDERGAAREVSP
jgi:hypothetical protein